MVAGCSAESLEGECPECVIDGTSRAGTQCCRKFASAHLGNGYRNPSGNSLYGGQRTRFATALSEGALCVADGRRQSETTIQVAQLAKADRHDSVRSCYPWCSCLFVSGLRCKGSFRRTDSFSSPGGPTRANLSSGTVVSLRREDRCFFHDAA